MKKHNPINYLTAEGRYEILKEKYDEKCNELCEVQAKYIKLLEQEIHYKDIAVVLSKDKKHLRRELNEIRREHLKHGYKKRDDM